jgi:predicted phosphohydrolase
MIVQYASDLHLDFVDNKQFISNHPILPKGEILLLAGDVVTFVGMNNHDDFFDYLAANFKVTYWVPGNHEYYHSNIDEKGNSFKEAIRENVFLLSNISVIHNDVKFIFSTLWAKISPENQSLVKRRLNDFHVIGEDDAALTIKRFNLMHQQCIDYINQELATCNGLKTVVVTHHVPTYLNYPERYKGDALNDAFAVELFDTIEASGCDVWVYGHIHHNTPDFTIATTRLLTNQLGYVAYDEHYGFDSSKCFEV